MKRFRRNRITCCAALVLWAWAASSSRAEIIFECAASGPTGQSAGSGTTVSAQAYTAVNFQITSTVTTGSIGCHLIDFDDARAVFGAIVKLTGPNDFPNTPNLTSSDVLGATLMYPPYLSDNVAGNLRLTLTPGWYALVIGSGRFGATGEAGAFGNNTPDGVSQPYTINSTTGQIVFQATPVRLFVDSDPVISFQRVVQTGDTIPGSAIAFTSLGAPAVRDGYVALRGSGPTDAGAFRYNLLRFHDDTLANLVNLGTPIPFGTGNFTDLTPTPHTGDGAIVFRGSGSGGQQGVYVVDGKGITRVTNLNTLIPGGSGNFTTLWLHNSIDDGSVAFTGVGANDQQGVYASFADGGLQVIADTNTPQPEGTANFDALPLQPISIDGDRVVFRGGNEPTLLLGLYEHVAGELRRIVDSNQTVPGGPAVLGYIGVGDARNGHTAMLVADGSPPTEIAIVKRVGGVMSLVANLDTPVPGGGSFLTFTEPGCGGRYVAFIGGSDSLRRAVYTDALGELTEVVGQGAQIDGRVIGATTNAVTLGTQPLDGRQLTFRCTFTDGVVAAFLAHLPAAGGDNDADNDVDLYDLYWMQNCYKGALVEVGDPRCWTSDTNGDRDVDHGDLRDAVDCLSGPDSDATCGS